MPKNESLTELPYGLNGRIYRSPLPFSPLFDPKGLVLDSYLDVGINTVVMLTPIAEVERLTSMNLKDRYEELGFDVIYAPVEDFSIPEKGAFQEPIRDTLRAANAGKRIVIHCHAGLGRTGMFAACLAKVVLNMDREAASAWVRQYIIRAVETREQAQFVREFQYQVD